MPLPTNLDDIQSLSEGQVGSLQRLESLLDRFLELQSSPENESRRPLWLTENCARDQWHGTPLPDRFRNAGIIPFTVDLQYPIWQRLWPAYDLCEVFTNPRTFLDFQLTRVSRQREFDIYKAAVVQNGAVNGCSADRILKVRSEFLNRVGLNFFQVADTASILEAV